MKAEFVDAFLTPAIDVYQKELGIELTFTQADAVTGVFTTSDLTAIIGVTGKLKGNVFYELTNATSLAIAGAMCGMDFEELDEMSISAIGELANMITGNATIALSEANYVCDISPHVLLPMGASVTVTNPPIRAHFKCSLGEMSKGEADGSGWIATHRQRHGTPRGHVHRVARYFPAPNGQEVCMAPIERNDPPGLSPPPGGRYAHVVSSGNLVWVAGQTARDASGTVVAPNDPLAQARQVYANLLTAIEAVGGTFANYVKLTIFLTSEEHLEAARTAQNECWGNHALPASSMVVVKALARPEYLIEIEGFAVLDS